MITVTLPFITKNPLNGAQGRSWTATMEASRRRKVQRQGTHIALMRPAEPARQWLKAGGKLEVTLTRASPGELDSHDGLRAALKSVADGVTDALGLTNDRDERLVFVYAQLKSKRYGVRVSLRPFGDSKWGSASDATAAIEALDKMHPPKPPGAA